MTQRNTIARSMHDLGLAAWFGGSLMGAIGLDAAAAKLGSPEDRSLVTTTAWGRWGPVNVAAAIAYVAGGARLASASKTRLLAQRGVGTATGTKTALTVLALGASGYISWEGMRAAGAETSAGGAETESRDDWLGATTRHAAERSASASDGAAQARSRLRVAGWTVPALTGALIVLSAYQGEQQRLSEILAGVVRGAPGRAAALRQGAEMVPVAKLAKAATTAKAAKAAKAGTKAGAKVGTKVGTKRRYRRPVVKAAKVAAKRRAA